MGDHSQRLIDRCGKMLLHNQGRFEGHYHVSIGQEATAASAPRPRLEIVLPASPRVVKGRLRTGVNSDNPTIVIDHALLFETKGGVPDETEAIHFGQADIRRGGGDVAVVATSLMLQRSLATPKHVANEGIQVALVDPRTIVPPLR